jgi:DNA repair protein RecO (recombination protein O)
VAVYETEALILRNYSLADADKIAVFLTRGFGIIKGVAKGAKKLKSRYGSALEPFTAVDLTYFIKDGHDLASITEIELRQSLFHTSTRPEVLKTLSYFGRLLIEFVPPNEPSDKIYRMVSACLEAVAGQPEELDQIALYFEAWLLRLAGFLPDWSRCVECGKKFGESEMTVLEATFHLSCLRCQPHRKEPRVTPRQRKMMVLLQALPPREFLLETAGDKKECRELSVNLQSIITHVLGKEIANTKYFLPEEIISSAAEKRSGAAEKQ